MTPSLRRLLKKPVGKLYTPPKLKNKGFLLALRSSALVVAVGDRVTESLQQYGRTPDVQVIDEVERRVKRTAPEVPFVRMIKAPNPAGTITAKAIRAIHDAFAGEMPVRVLIDGEEDLLAIAAIEAAPLGSRLYYGQPGKGIVVVEIDERSKASANRILERMMPE